MVADIGLDEEDCRIAGKVEECMIELGVEIVEDELADSEDN